MGILFKTLAIWLLPCLLLADSFLAPSSGPQEKPSSLVIYAIGDSITRGIDDIGYRKFLVELLASRGVRAHMIGSEQNGPAGFKENHHEGHNGWTIGDIGHEIHAWLERFDPEVILLMIGSNDIEQAVDVSHMPERMDHLLEQIRQKRPNAILYVSEVSLIDHPLFDRQARTFNQKMKKLVEQKKLKNHRIVFVPMHDVLSRENLIELDHPDPAGNLLMAQRWLQFLLQPLL